MRLVLVVEQALGTVVREPAEVARVQLTDTLVHLPGGYPYMMSTLGGRHFSSEDAHMQ